MRFEDILSSCIDALGQGATIEECLARYPTHAEELAPLLRLTLSLQASAKPQLSDQQFTQGRSAVAAAAQRAQQDRASAQASEATAPLSTAHQLLVPNRRFRVVGRNGATPGRTPLRNGHRSRRVPTPAEDAHPTHVPTILRYLRAKQSRSTLASSAMHQRPPRRRSTHHSLQLVLAVLTLVLLFSGSVLLWQAALSVPGSPFYGIKTVGERAQGMLLTAAGEGASWHAAQMVRRVEEAAELADRPAQTLSQAERTRLTTMLMAQATAHAQQAQQEAALLPLEEQRALYAVWRSQLEEVMQPLLQQRDLAAALVIQETLAQLEAASAALEQSPTPVTADVENALSVTLTATSLTAIGERTPVATSTFAGSTETLLPSVTATRSVAPSDNKPTATRVLRATAVPVATSTPVAPLPPTRQPPTATAMPVLGQTIPLEAPSSDNNDASDNGTVNREPTDDERSDSDSDSDSTSPSTDDSSVDSEDSTGLDDQADAPAPDPSGEVSEESTEQEEEGNGEEAALPTATSTPLDEVAPTAEATVTPAAVAATPMPSATDVATPALPDATALPPTATGDDAVPDNEPPPGQTPAAPRATRVLPDATPVPNPVVTEDAPTSFPDVVDDEPQPERRPTRSRRSKATPQPDDESSLPAQPDVVNEATNSSQATVADDPSHVSIP